MYAQLAQIIPNLRLCFIKRAPLQNFIRETLPWNGKITKEKKTEFSPLFSSIFKWLLSDGLAPPSRLLDINCPRFLSGPKYFAIEHFGIRNLPSNPYLLLVQLAPSLYSGWDFLFTIEIDSWNFQQMLNLGFSETSQNFSSFRQLFFKVSKGVPKEKNSKTNV